MEILVDGNRSTNDSWTEAHRISAQALPKITEDDQRIAEKLAIPVEEYVRLQYAADLTRKQLEMRASQVGQLVEGWLRKHGIAGEVNAVWLKTFEGKYRVDVQTDSALQNVFFREEIIDDLLEGGSPEAKRKLDLLLSANFLVREAAWAS